MKKIIIINGPNLNLLGKREPEVYGSLTFSEFLETIREKYPNVELDYFQSNIEGELIDKIQDETDKRKVKILVSPAGKDLCASIYRSEIQIIGKAVVRIGTDKQ